ncbi:hypothetical protein C7460_1331 [Marinoscillum furvescens DSM 4134]|uniref:Uncharacterized protein n=2 Tax=Marinoscillum furvescens TaxID=1026 RepID=A0A3D9KX21_MARFU|nr:hypothetical protein C7460_1331 [Marinoscillum furvescens DSM 4134]
MLLGLLIFSCSTNKSSEKANGTDSLEHSESKALTSFDSTDTKAPQIELGNASTFDMGTGAILFISPDSAETAQMKEKLGDDFYVVADDQNFYFSQAADFLDSRSVKYEFTNKRFITLKLNHKWNHTDHPVTEITIDTDTLEYKWITIMHDGYDPPIISAYIDVPTNFEELDE